MAQFRKNGRSRRIAIGEHGRLTPDEARSEAKKLLGAVETGADPIEQRQAARGVRTFREIADEFMRKHVASKRKDRTRYEYGLLLNVHILPSLVLDESLTSGGTTSRDCTLRFPIARSLQIVASP